MRKCVSVLLIVLLMSATLFAAGAKEDASVPKIGVSMPTQSLQRWNQDGANMKSQLEAAGYRVDLQYA
ncbi:MAG: ABC transporter substrate-binding protein, partial [Spirochaetia bacterium]|nr:ABC transporter substrate-binding protein [Spirochaetia bacterium]